MLHYLLTQPVKIIFGSGSVSKLAEVMETEGKKKAFIVTDKGIVAAGVLKKVTTVLEQAQIDYVVYDEILPDAPVDCIEKGFSLLQKENCDLVIALGGGSTIDSSKAINLLRYNSGPLLRYTDFSTPIKDSPGLLCIPTTAGTGSELSDGIIVSDSSHRKCTILTPKPMAEFALLDPDLLVGTPPHITASTGCDALSHLIEGYLSTLANPLTDQICLGSAQLALKWLPVAVKDGANIEARSNMLASSALGGWMLSQVHCNAGHSISHILGSLFNIPHGYGCAFAMPYVTEFNAVAIPERTKIVGELYGLKFSGSESPQEIGKKTSEAMVHFRDMILGLKKAKEFTFDRARFAEAAKLIVNEGFQNFNPRKMEEADAMAILEKIFA